MKTNKYLKAIKELVCLTIDQEVFNAMKKGTLKENEMFPALCLVTHQFDKAQQILKKYEITI